MKQTVPKRPVAGRRRTRHREDWIIIVDVPKLLRLVLVLVVTASTLISGFLLIRRFLPVKEIEVVGISIYDSTDIINASGIKRGDLMYELDEDAIVQKILDECPYLSSVTLTEKFPNRLKIEVEGRSAQWYIDVSDTKYALDGNLVVIAETKRTDGMIKLVLPNLKSVIVGDVPQFSESETELKKTLEVISAIRQTTFQSRITEVNLESRWDIHITVDGSYEITMGDRSDFAAKLKAVEGVLGHEILQNSIGGTIDASDPANLAVQPIYAPSDSSDSQGE